MAASSLVVIHAPSVCVCEVATSNSFLPLNTFEVVPPCCDGHILDQPINVGFPGF